jgi:hypothetical protein
VPNPKGINQYSKGGGKSRAKKKGSSTSKAKLAAQAKGFTGKLNTDRRFGARTAAQKATATRKRYASN